MADVPRPPRPTTPIAPSERLSAALAEADRAFGPRTDSIGPVDGCTHCFDAEHLRTIGGPVDDIPEWLFSRALGKWGTTMDADSRLWRRLTPRILREMTSGTLHKDESLMARKFNEAGWRDWPPRETASLEDVCHAWWHAALAGMSQASGVTVLGFVVPLTGDVQPWLDRWDTCQDRAAALQLRDLWQSWMPELLDGRLDGEGPDIAASVSTWLLRQSPERLDLGGFNAQDRFTSYVRAEPWPVWPLPATDEHHRHSNRSIRPSEPSSRNRFTHLYPVAPARFPARRLHAAPADRPGPD